MLDPHLLRLVLVGMVVAFVGGIIWGGIKVMRGKK